VELQQFVEWLQTRKQYVIFATIFVVVLTYHIPGRSPIFALVIRGFLWHMIHAESASLFWEGIGCSEKWSRFLGAIFGTLCGFLFCLVGFSLRKMQLTKWHSQIVNHRWTEDIPYALIVIVGLFFPIGGLIMGIIIARVKNLPKQFAIATILATNFFKLYFWGGMLMFLSHLIHSLIRR
jgi:hypothetical protein